MFWSGFSNFKITHFSRGRDCLSFNLLSSAWTFNKCVLMAVILFELRFFTNGYFHFPCNPIQRKVSAKTESNYSRAQPHNESGRLGMNTACLRRTSAGMENAARPLKEKARRGGEINSRQRQKKKCQHSNENVPGFSVSSCTCFLFHSPFLDR